MENENQPQNLSRLYTLRAGMSVVMQEKEITDKIVKNAANEKSKAIEQAEFKRARIKNEEELAKKNYEKAKTNYQGAVNKKISDEETAKCKIPRADSSYLAAGIGWLLLTIFLFALTAAFVGGFILSFKDCVSCRDFDMQTEKAQFGIGIAFLILGLPLAAACLALIFAKISDERMTTRITDNFQSYSRSKAKFRAKIKDRENCKNSYQANLNAVINAEMQVKNTKNLYETAKRAYEEACDKFESEKVEINKTHSLRISEAANHVVAGLTFYDGLVETFRDLVDERDWSDLDLIIYYFETRRAESMKEALHLVDRERQTDKIANAVTRASREICRTMSISIARLQNDMRNCFNVLSKEIILQTQILVNEMGAMREQTQFLSQQIMQQNRYIQNLSSATNMNNALVATQNITSAQIL